MHAMITWLFWMAKIMFNVSHEWTSISSPLTVYLAELQLVLVNIFFDADDLPVPAEGKGLVLHDLHDIEEIVDFGRMVGLEENFLVLCSRVTDGL